uniref:VWFA domain-containing protein n=1 Tax=Panagrolaimus sp. ES5 TaxID=591445 RepID=A0AC34G222_9BILA
MSNITSWMAESVDDTPPSWTHGRTPRRNPGTAQLRETNKRLRTIYNEAGLNYGEDVVEKELTERFKVAINLRKANVQGVLKNIRQAKNVEICFLVDATGSMQKHINGVKDSINQIVNLLKQPNDDISLRKKSTANKLRLSMVAYRDFCDSNRFEILDFTESVANFKNFCSDVVADGGGDGPEDVFGGIDKVLNLQWTDECGTKVIFHIADAPCHGRKYHAFDDSFPEGDPNGLTEVGLFKEIVRKKIDYYFGKINSWTDNMIDVFSNVYELTGRFLNFEMPESVQDVINDVPLFRNPPKRAVVQVAPKPFAHVAERYAFYGRDVTTTSNPKSIVFKEYRTIGTGNAAARYEITNQIQTIASFFAMKYNKAFKRSVGYNYCIEFLKVQTLCIPG